MPSYTRIPSLSTALEQERLELLQEVHDQRKSKPRHSSPARKTTTATAPARNVDNHHNNGPSAPSARAAPLPGELPPRHGSIAGIGVGVTPPSARNNGPPSHLRNSSISDSPDSPPSPTTTTSTVTTSSTAPPPLPKPKTTTSSAPPPLEQPSRRRASDQSSEKSLEHKTEHKRPSIRWDDSVSMSPSHGAARRSSQQSQEKEKEKPPNRTLPGKNAMAAVMSGLDLRVNLPSFARGRDSSSRSSSRRGASLDSRFSAPRFARSSSPKNRMISPSNTRTPPPASSLAKSSTDTVKTTEVKRDKEEDKEKDKENGEKNPKLPAHQEEPENAEKPSSTEDVRLEKDKYDNDNNLIESSEEEDDDSSSSDDDDDSPPEEVERGRSKTTRSSTDNSEAETSTSSSPSPSTSTTISPTSTAQSQPETNGKEEHEDKIESSESAAEKSDFIHSSKFGPIPKKPDVHPRTSFDASPSVPTTPFGSDDEAELSDIKRAQKLGIQMSTINSSVHNRSIRTIIRGNYTNLPEYADGSRRRRRKYMVATDLSEESVYALEWTIGTILRDGDTLFAVCAIYEETGAPTSVQIGEGAKAMQDAAAVVGTQTEETTAQKPHNDSGTNLPRALLGRLGSGTDSKPGSVDSRGMSKTEAERVRAVESISETCVRLLRKTVLQVRVAVEVIHCKSPKHMLTEAIDGLDPTLVIVGARGRSALKGVLLGSFSNYLVMHSSVPVMVARRKLKKHSKNKKTNIRLSNNLATPKKLAYAKVD